MQDIVTKLRHHKAGRFEQGVNEKLMDEAAGEIQRLRRIETRLDLAIVMLPTFDGNGPGDCTDRLVAAVQAACKRLTQ